MVSVAMYPGGVSCDPSTTLIVTESDITVISVTTGGTGIDFSGIRSVNCVINYQYEECILPAGGVATVTGSENGPVPISLYEATIQV